MGAAHTELIETGDKRDGRGRRLVTRERRAELVAAYRESGLTQAAFARREGVKYTTFTYWVQQSVRAGRRRTAVRFAEVRLPPSALSAALEVRLLDGTILRGSSVAELAALVRALRA